MRAAEEEEEEGSGAYDQDSDDALSEKEERIRHL